MRSTSWPSRLRTPSLLQESKHLRQKTTFSYRLSSRESLILNRLLIHKFRWTIPSPTKLSWQTSTTLAHLESLTLLSQAPTTMVGSLKEKQLPLKQPSFTRSKLANAILSMGPQPRKLPLVVSFQHVSPKSTRIISSQRSAIRPYKTSQAAITTKATSSLSTCLFLRKTMRVSTGLPQVPIS